MDQENRLLQDMDPQNYQTGDRKEDGFRRVCRGELKGTFDGNFTQPSIPRCHYLHQNDPYLSKLLRGKIPKNTPLLCTGNYSNMADLF